MPRSELPGGRLPAAILLFLPPFCPINCSPLPSPDGVTAFHTFLKTEFSEENLDFWLACEDFKKTRSKTKLASKANRIFEEFVQNEAPREVRGFSFSVLGRQIGGKGMQYPGGFYKSGKMCSCS